MPKIFEAFTRLDTVQRDCLGIGLFIVRQALGLLGHRVDVTSNPSRGSRFSILAARLGRGVSNRRKSPADNNDAKERDNLHEVRIDQQSECAHRLREMLPLTARWLLA
jgi:hypothetical protein